MDLIEPIAAELVHPCVKCGACCGTFRVLFDPAEIKDSRYQVPKDLTEKVDAQTRAMLGTNEAKPRCVALGGRIGHAVGCTVYANRPSCCREFKPSFEDGTRNERCDFARRNKGLRPLRPADYGRR